MCKEKWRKASLLSRPALTEGHRQARLDWALVNREKEWTDYVDIDEKYFETVPLRRRTRVPPGELGVKQRVLSKSNVKKVMVLVAVARPRPEHEFDGKIGVWRVTKQMTAQRNSKNHIAGETYEVDASMTAQIFRQLVITKLIPTIRRKMRWATQVTVQMDNAPPHVGEGNLEALQLAGIPVGKASCRVSFVCQPPMSPDTNVLDLALFRSMSTAVFPFRINSSEHDVDGLFHTIHTSKRTHSQLKSSRASCVKH